MSSAARLAFAVLSALAVLLSAGATVASAAPSCPSNSAEYPNEALQDSQNTPLYLNSCHSDSGSVTYAVKSTSSEHGGTVSQVVETTEYWGTSRQVKYTPKAGFTGPDTFVITATDADGSTDSTYYVKVKPRTAPVCSDQPAPESGQPPIAIRSGRSKYVNAGCY